LWQSIGTAEGHWWKAPLVGLHNNIVISGALISGQVTVFKSFLSRNSKYFFNLYQYSKLSQGNNSTNQPIPVNEDSVTNDQILKIITGESGYFFQIDEHLIQMVEAGCCGPGALYYRYQMDTWGENPFTVILWKNWRKGCMRIF
jgi:hypothetical protein